MHLGEATGWTRNRCEVGRLAFVYHSERELEFRLTNATNDKGLIIGRLREAQAQDVEGFHTAWLPGFLRCTRHLASLAKPRLNQMLPN